MPHCTVGGMGSSRAARPLRPTPKKAKNGSAGRVAELEPPLGERDRVAVELTAANRGEVRVGRPLPPRGVFRRRQGKEGGGDARRGRVWAFEETPYARRGGCRAPEVPTVTANTGQF